MDKFKCLLLLFTINILFPSICSSELKTVEGEYCETYVGDMENKNDLEDFRGTVRKKAVIKGLRNLRQYLNYITLKETCVSNIISNNLDKITIISHKEKDNIICEKIKMALDDQVIISYLKNNCFVDDAPSWDEDIDKVLTKNIFRIKIGLIIETKIPDIEKNKREQIENEEESHFWGMTERSKDKYKVIDSRHLSSVVEKQELSSFSITKNETVKLGNILNLDVIVFRLIYENSKVTKVLKANTGEVLLFKTYKTENDTKKE